MSFDVLRSVLKRERPSAVIPVSAYDHASRAFYLSDGCLAFSLCLGPLVGAGHELGEKINTILRFDFPPNSMLQVMLLGSPDISYHTDQIVEERKQYRGTCNDVLIVAKEKEANFYAAHVDKPIEDVNFTQLRDFQIFISLKVPCSSGSVPTDDDMTRIKELKGRLLRGFEAIGMYGFAMTAAEWLYRIGAIVNWDKNASWRSPLFEYDETRFINEQLFDLTSEICPDAKGFWIGGKRVVALSPKRMPAEASIALANALISDIRTSTRGVRGTFIANVNIYYPDYHRAKADLASKRQYVSYQAFGKMTQFLPRIGGKKASFDTLFASIDDGDRIVRVCPSFFVFGDSEQEASDTAVGMATYYTELGYQLQEDRFIGVPLFINALPMCADRHAVDFFERYYTMTSRHASHLLPIAADWKGTGRHTMTFSSRNGQLQPVCLYQSQTNFNAVVCAQSGSGKSFLTNYLVSSYLSVGAQVWCVDVGRSYKKLAAVANGDFVEFGHNAKMCLNPFPLIKDYDDEADAIVGLIAAMACPTEDALDALQVSRLKEYVKTGWEQFSHGLTIDIIAESLKCDPDTRIVEIGHRLYPFTSFGEYGAYFNGENNASFAADFTVLELEELKQKPHLQSVVLLQLIYQIQQQMYLGDMSRKKILIIDEAWDLLKHPRIAAFIEGGYRRFRKYNGCAICVTQSVYDLYNDRTGRAIAENSAHVILLGQKREVINRLQEERKLDLTDGGFEILKTVASRKGVYSEIFFYLDSGSQVGIGRLVVDRFTQLLYTTDGDEVSAINAICVQGFTIIEAINRFIELENQRKGLC